MERREAGRVYPRPRGGTCSARTPAARGRGLSPPTRGNPRGCERGRLCPGSIPAHAGEPRAPKRQPMWKTVYPRPRGGTRALRLSTLPLMGLSPPTRGNLGGIPSGGGEEGSIPAHAGEPSRASSPESARRVYPRPRGGTGFGNLGKDAQEGLSPPTRGNPLAEWEAAVRARSIPAHAGEPLVDSPSHRLTTVYPRPRGGTVSRPMILGGEKGLSPPTRGNRISCRKCQLCQRSIPAHAGEPAGRRLAWR